MLEKFIATIKLLTTGLLKLALQCVYKCVGWFKPSTAKGNSDMSTSAYPSDFPLAEAKNVIEIVRSGNLIEQKESLAHDAWVVQGYAQSMLIGTPPSILAAQATALKNSEIEPLAALERIVADTESGALSAQIAVPWTLIIKYVIEILLSLLDE